MGQYFKVVNLDKREYLQSSGGVKLMEFSWEANPVCTTLKDLLSSSWKGDHVYLVGDYYDEDEVAFSHIKNVIHNNSKLKEFSDDISIDELKEHWSFPDGLTIEAVENARSNVYGLPFTMVECAQSPIKDYVAYNHTKKEYCKLYEGVFEEVDVHIDPAGSESWIGIWRVDPLNLLMAIGATFGAGGYFSEASKDLVGSWALDDIELFTKGNDPKYIGYTEIAADFTESSTINRLADLPEIIRENRSLSFSDFLNYYSEHSDELKDFVSKPFVNVWMHKNWRDKLSKEEAYTTVFELAYTSNKSYDISR